MTPSRGIQCTAFALALSITLATLGSLNLLAQDQSAARVMAKAASVQQAAAAQPSATAPRS